MRELLRWLLLASLHNRFDLETFCLFTPVAQTLVLSLFELLTRFNNPTETMIHSAQNIKYISLENSETCTSNEPATTNTNDGDRRFDLAFLNLWLDYLDAENNISRYSLAYWDKDVKTFSCYSKINETKFPGLKGLFESNYLNQAHFMRVKARWNYVPMLFGCAFKNQFAFAFSKDIFLLSIKSTIYSFGRRIFEFEQTIKAADLLRDFDFCNGFFEAFFNDIQCVDQETAGIAIENLSLVQVFREKNAVGQGGSLLLCLAWEFLNQKSGKAIEVQDLVKH